MYTQLDDQRQASKINQYLIKYPNTTKKEVASRLFTNFHRLQYLINKGLIDGFTKKNN